VDQETLLKESFHKEQKTLDRIENMGAYKWHITDYMTPIRYDLTLEQYNQMFKRGFLDWNIDWRKKHTKNLEEAHKKDLMLAMEAEYWDSWKRYYRHEKWDKDGNKKTN